MGEILANVLIGPQTPGWMAPDEILRICPARALCFCCLVAQIGLRMGVMGASVYGIVVVIPAATTLIAPPLLKLAFRGVPHEGGRATIASL